MSGPEKFHGVVKIVSGGQTGVDQAALDVALELGIPHGGWCPKGRLCEHGRIDERYQLTELPTPEYAARTLRNVIDSDGTLILYRQRLQGGSGLTQRLAKQHGKPVLSVRLDRAIDYLVIIDWLHSSAIGVLNIAGPRASSAPGVQRQARTMLRRLFQESPGLLHLDRQSNAKTSGQ
ncbi:MAG: putative molybdenum carrier protein [Pirellulaceae bacterium]|nr:putative molybdenum carrier protein [Pirellulaceae bacterium]